MEPFQACFNRLVKIEWNTKRKFHWPEECKIAIRMWRAILYLVSVDELSYAKKLFSFRKTPVQYVVETDASLSQEGFIIFEVTDSCETCLGGGAVSIEEFGFGVDSSYQNTAEFIGALVGLLALVKLGGRDAGVKLRGDSTTALYWAASGRVSGSAALNAAVVLSALSVKYGLEVNDTEFLAGVDNHKADNLSRVLEKGKSVEQAMIENGLGGKRIMNLRDDLAAEALIAACNPSRGSDTEAAFIELWGEIREALGRLRVD